jgi:hypothetical protein
VSLKLLTSALASIIFMAVILLLDGPGAARQLALGGATLAFLWLVMRRLAIPRRQVLIAIAVASAGEVVLSLVWGLYSYRYALIPLYVPPGHGLVYGLAAATAADRAIRRHASPVTLAAVLAGTALAIASLAVFGDTWGFLWWTAAFLLIWRSRSRLLLATCFIYTILLEWGGTAIGNWTWAAEVPHVGMVSANPPSGVGVLYIVLDLVVVLLARSSMSITPSKQTATGTAGVVLLSATDG